MSTQLTIAAVLICTGLILIIVAFLTRKWQYCAAAFILNLAGTILALRSFH